MVDPVREIKIRAELLQRRMQQGDVRALRRLPAARELLQDEEALRALARTVRRKHCLHVVSVELGFRDYAHALRVLEGHASENDLGDLLCTSASGGYLNCWFKEHSEARQHKAQQGGYLLAYRRQFLIVDAPYIADMGLDPDDHDWVRIDRDWARPRDVDARRRLYGKLLAHKPAEQP